MQVWLPSVSALIVVLISTTGAVLAAVYVANHNIKASLESSKRQIEASLETSTLQIRANTVTSVRMKWIESFREAVAQLLTSSLLFATKTNTQERHEHRCETLLQVNRTVFLLDASDETHGRLRENLVAIIGLITEKDLDKIGDLQNAIGLDAISILKSEWEKIARLR